MDGLGLGEGAGAGLAEPESEELDELEDESLLAGTVDDEPERLSVR